jgi:Predicted membrane protein (DUF2207)
MPQSQPREWPRSAGVRLSLLWVVALLGLGLLSEALAGWEPLRRSATTLWIAAGALALLWLIAVAGVRLAREPRNPDPGPATNRLRGEPPAVAGMLVNNFAVTRHAVPATVLDLAARGVVRIEHVGPGHDVVRLGRATRELLPYEHAVMAVLRARARDGVVPVGALAMGSREHARGWWRSFRGAVIRDAQGRGLSRDLWDDRSLSVLLVLGLLPAPLVALAGRDTWLGIFPAIVVAATLAALRATERQRETPAGMALASQWLGIRRGLAESASLEDVPPSGVVVWERPLAYAAAMGLARESLRVMPMGADDERLAWSSHGGVWRKVRITYPRWWPPGWGWPPWAAIMVGAAIALLGLGALRVAAGIGWPEDDPLFPSIVIALRVFAVIAAALGVLFAVWGLTAAIRGLLDLGSPRRITGQVLRVRKRGDDEPRHYVAIDDGTSDVVRALRVTSGGLNDAGLRQYGDATAEITPTLRHVRSIRPA